MEIPLVMNPISLCSADLPPPLLLKATQPPSGDIWLHEIKLDGSGSLRARMAIGCSSIAVQAMT
jgi:ATP-dependent DNA ligase